jgi:hypothetical protein
MREKTVALALLSGLLSIAVLSARAGREKTAELSAAPPISLKSVLQAHNVVDDPGRTAIFFAEAQRTVSASAAGSSEMPSSFDRMVTVSRQGKAYRYQRVDPIAHTKTIYVFDGNTTSHAMMVEGRLVKESNHSGDSPSEAVGLEIKTFGLLPILKQLADPNTQSIYEGQNAEGLDRFQVRTSTRLWIVYAGAQHLIRRVESGGNAIDYDDYRSVDGVWLPYFQQFSVRGKRYYNLTFNRIDLKADFSRDYFSRESFLKEIGR